MDSSQQLKLARMLVRQLSDELREISKVHQLGSLIGIQGVSGDNCKFADTFIETLVKEHLTNFCNQHHCLVTLISEESGITEFKPPTISQQLLMILDPLDGSNNLRPFITPAPSIAISLATGNLVNFTEHKDLDGVESAVVIDVFNQRVFQAEYAQQSEIDGYGPIQTSPIKELDEAIVGMSFDYQDILYQKTYQRLAGVMSIKKCQRRIGSTILDLMKVACGEYDACLSLGYKLGIHDLAAAKLIIENAGGVFEILTYQGPKSKILSDLILSHDTAFMQNKYEVLASGNATIHGEIKKILV